MDMPGSSRWPLRVRARRMRAAANALASTRPSSQHFFNCAPPAVFQIRSKKIFRAGLCYILSPLAQEVPN